MNVVISQPMYFPWVGILEQVRLADTFVHYDDVQFTRGFFNRVQVKSPSGAIWLTVPTRNQHRGQSIDDVLIDERQNWRARHRETLRRIYSAAPYLADMLSVVDHVFDLPAGTIAEISSASIGALVDYFDLAKGRRFLNSRSLNISGSGSSRLLAITRVVGGTVYITGHGARNYLDHELFEAAGVSVEYIDYRRTPYAQLHGAFTPFVSSLDLIANCGRAGIANINSASIPWRLFIHGTTR